MKLIKNYKEGKLTTADVRTINNTVICLMVLVAATSIIWSISVHILTGDFYNGIIGAKLTFRERDFMQMDERAKRILERDLEKLLNDIYSKPLKSNETSAELSLIPKPLETLDTTEHNQTTTRKPKVRTIPHVFRVSSNWDAPEVFDDKEQDDADVTTAAPLFDVEKDRKFLKTMFIDVYQTRWNQSIAVQFVYSFPFLSEMTAIIWAAMCLIFQSGVKKYWGLPKPWRIVVPSILIFAIMTIGSLTYTVYANNYLKTFCTDIRANLSNPEALSCGQAILVLRPAIRQHDLPHDVYLNLFRASYGLSLLWWVLALLIMLLRYFFAIDFQLVDILHNYEHTVPAVDSREIKFTEVPLNSPKRQSDLLRVDERHISEDDFQSAKSQLSEVAIPLLDHNQQRT